MAEVREKIAAFLGEHHILTLATVSEAGAPQCATLFYAYLPEEGAFVVASDPATEHMGNALRRSAVAGTVALETKTVGKIRGIQFTGEMRAAAEGDAKAYFAAFPYALAMNPKLWRIVLNRVKLTDNRLGFGTKLTWERDGLSG